MSLKEFWQSEPDEIIRFIENRSKRQTDDIKMMYRVAAWQTAILLSSLSGKKVKESDILIWKEDAEKMTEDRISWLKSKEVQDTYARWDKEMAEKWKKEQAKNNK